MGEQINTAMVTGGTGYIGSWVVKYLLEDGVHVHLTVRDKSKKEKYDHLLKIAKTSEGSLMIFEADLLKQGSYLAPMEGCDRVFHIASPFLISNIKNPQKQLIEPALNGTRNVLGAVNETASVTKVVLTSSVVSIVGDNSEIGNNSKGVFTEDDWNQTSSPEHKPYSYSKVIAEKEAWAINKAQQKWELAVINPGFVMGPSLTSASDSGSLDFMTRMLSGKYKSGVPSLEFGVVDVRDIARAHILAANLPVTGRYIIVNESMTMIEISKMLQRLYGSTYKLPNVELPKFILYLVGWTQGMDWKTVKNNVGLPLKFDNSKSKTELKMDYLPLEQTFKDMTEQMVKLGLV